MNTEFKQNRTYLFVLDTVELATSKKGTQGIRFSLVSEAGDTEGKTISDTIWMTSKTKWKVDQFLEATGETELGALNEVDLFKRFSGKHVKAKIVLEEGNTDPKTGIKYDDRLRIGNLSPSAAGATPAPQVDSDDSENAGDIPF